MKVAKFCEISTVDLPYVVTVNSKVEVLKKIVAFSEYMNFKKFISVFIELEIYPQVCPLLGKRLLKA